MDIELPTPEFYMPSNYQSPPTHRQSNMDIERVDNGRPGDLMRMDGGVMRHDERREVDGRDGGERRDGGEWRDCGERRDGGEWRDGGVMRHDERREVDERDGGERRDGGEWRDCGERRDGGEWREDRKSVV